MLVVSRYSRGGGLTISGGVLMAPLYTLPEFSTTTSKPKAQPDTVFLPDLHLLHSFASSAILVNYLRVDLSANPSHIHVYWGSIRHEHCANSLVNVCYCSSHALDFCNPCLR